MPDFPFPVPSRTLLAAALHTLRDLHDPTACELNPAGHCPPHGWYQATACPQLRARLILRQADKQPVPAAYAVTVLRAALRGLAPGQEAHARVRVNGHTHRAHLSLTPPADPQTGPGDASQITARLSCGAVIAPLDPGDVLEFDVHTPAPDPEFDALLEGSSLGSPRVRAADPEPPCTACGRSDRNQRWQDPTGSGHQCDYTDCMNMTIDGEVE